MRAAGLCFVLVATAAPLFAVSHNDRCKTIPSKLLIVKGDGQTVPMYGSLAMFQPLTVQVTICNTPIPNEIVTFTCAADSGAAIACVMPNGSQFKAGMDGKVSLTGLVVSGFTGGVTVTASVGPDKMPPALFHLTVAPVPTITVSAPPGGRITGGGLNCGDQQGPCSVSATGPQAITLTATPDEGEVFAGWSGACAGQGNPCTITPTSSQTVGAQFGLVVDSYGGICTYKCCDANANCADYYAWVSDCTSGCTWNAICAKGGPGWSVSPYPIGPQYSTLSCTSGCWQLVNYADGSGEAIVTCQ